MKTLRALNNEVYRWYQTTKKPVSVECRINNCYIAQEQLDGNAGWTHISLANGENITINWQATNANIFIDKVSDEIMDFLYETIKKREKKFAIETYYFVNIKNDPAGSDFLDVVFFNYEMAIIREELDREDIPLEYLA